MQAVGLVHLYTGTGKGKTTAAVGLAVRALGQGMKVCYALFNKNPQKYGINETHILEKLGAKVMVLTGDHPSFKKSITKNDHCDMSLLGFHEVEREIQHAKYDVLILDEILISVRDNFINEDVVLEFVKNKAKNLELVLTGRGATEKLIKLADYVSEINAVKHPMNKGITSRKGIEY